MANSIASACYVTRFRTKVWDRAAWADGYERSGDGEEEGAPVSGRPTILPHACEPLDQILHAVRQVGVLVVRSQVFGHRASETLRLIQMRGYGRHQAAREVFEVRIVAGCRVGFEHV